MSPVNGAKMWPRQDRRRWQKMAKINAGQRRQQQQDAGCTTKSQINYACSVPQQQQQQLQQPQSRLSLLFCFLFSFFCGLSTARSTVPRPPTTAYCASTLSKTIKAIKKSLYKLAAFCLIFFHYVPSSIAIGCRKFDQWRRFAGSANACVAAQSETAGSIRALVSRRLFTEPLLGN